MEEQKVKKRKVSKEKTPKQPLNIWKVAFLSLAGILLGATILIVGRIYLPREAKEDMPSTTLIASEPILTINSTKDQVNQLIDHYLQSFLKDSDVQYHFYLKNEALLTGEFELFGFATQFYLYFEPYVMEDGNVQLRTKSLSLGSLNLPVTDLLGMVKRAFDFPEWVEVNEEEKMILLHLDKFEIPSGLFIKAEKINLVDDEIRFSLYLSETNEETDATNESNIEE
ncbi:MULTISPECIES: YpmS family protein [unclassified Enterococcus]|uniref:YpmS family protein n=1 Tax=unclassified Enterococcus TaxID=2608891 RepID=UPI0024745BBF|nr:MULTISPECIES: YpmS family protein [unclassified Enterococcus]